jgi:hypothetical protein
MMMQNLVLSTQNQVAPTDLGSASSTVTFFRSLGGAVGVSALGAIMAHRITTYFTDGLADLSPKYARLAAHASSDGAIPDLAKLPRPLRTLMESSYGHAIADVFLIAACLAFLAFVITLFIKEVPLRTKGGLAQAAATDSEAEAEEAPAAAAEAAAPVEEHVPSWAVSSTEAAPDGAQKLAAVATLAPPTSAGEGGGVPVRGFVRGTESAPVPQAAVTLISLGGRQLGRSVARPDGSYGVDAPGAGSYVLIASADGYQPQASTILVHEEPVSYDILLSGTSGLSGVVRAAETGLPVKDAMVIVTDVRGDLLATAATGEQGEFSFADLVPGSVTVAVNAAGHRPRALPVEIGATGVTRLEVDLDSGAQVQGVVRAPHGPLADARVTLVDAAGNVVGSATTGTDGAYAFTDLNSGEYTVIATGYPPAATAVSVSGRGVDDHDIELAHPGE